jgi:tetratricopeptide (TPR) repeat protein
LSKNKKYTKPENKVQPNVFLKFILGYKEYLFFCLPGFILYAQTINFSETYHDDFSLLAGSYPFLKHAGNIFKIFTQSVFHNTVAAKDYYYRPVLTLSFFLDAQLAGQSLKFSHFANIFYHVIAACIVFNFFRKFSIEKQPAFCLALLFTIHPALVQAVAWVPGRNDILLAIFSLLACISLINFIRFGKRNFFITHILFFFVAILTKETAVLLPLLFLALIIYFLKKKSSILKTNHYLLLICSWFIACAVFFAIRKIVLGTSVGLPLSYILRHAFFNTPALILYIGKMILPFNLSTYPVLQDSSLIYGIITILLIFFALYISKKKDYLKISFGIFWLLIFLVPAIVPTTDEYETGFLEHRMYLPLVGFLLLVSETDLVKQISFKKQYSIITFSIAGILFFVLSLAHSKDYKNELNYYQSAVDANPRSSFALRGLGTYYFSNKQYETAKNYYLSSLKINPGIHDVRNDLGRIYMNLNLNDRAEKLFREEIDRSPESAMPYYNLGLLALSKNNLDSAEAFIRTSLQYDPSYIEAQNDLAVILSYKKNYEEAVNLYIQILEQIPGYYSAKENLNLIFNIWGDKLKVEKYKQLLAKKGIAI